MRRFQASECSLLPFNIELKKAKQHMHSLFHGSDLFDFKMYLLITSGYKVLKLVCSSEMSGFLNSFVQDIKQSC